MVLKLVKLESHRELLAQKACFDKRNCHFETRKQGIPEGLNTVMVPILALLIAATLATSVQGDAITGLLRNREESQVLREVRSHSSSMISRLTRPNARIGLECHVSPCLETPNGHMAPCRNGTCHQGGTVSTGAEGRGATGTYALKLAT